MNPTSDTFGQDDFEADPETNAAASPLPRSIGQTSLVNNVNDIEPDATLTDFEPISSSTTALVREFVDDLFLR